MSRNNDLVVILARIYNTTDSAILVGEPGLLPSDSDQMDWLPLSLVAHTKELPGSKVELEIPRWLMDKKELDHLEKP